MKKLIIAGLISLGLCGVAVAATNPFAAAKAVCDAHRLSPVSFWDNAFYNQNCPTVMHKWNDWNAAQNAKKENDNQNSVKKAVK
jgi:hypothetical protein